VELSRRKINVLGLAILLSLALTLAIWGDSPFPDPSVDRQLVFSNGPSGVAIAPGGRLYVAVYQHNQVYSYPDAAAVDAGATPDLTFGGSNVADPDANRCNNVAVSAVILCGPESVAVDSAGNLYVADTYNHRVMVFLNPDSDADPTTADVVLGQPDMTGFNINYDSNPADGIVEGFYFPRGLALDPNDNLYVVDEFNHRLLKFNQPLTTDSLPDVVLGQDDLDELVGGFDSGQSANNRFNLPLGVAVDASGNVYATDFNNNRVLRFDAPLTNGATAAQVYSGLSGPHDAAVDHDGNLYVADTKNLRVLVFAAPLSGDTASDHTFPGLDFPMGMAFDLAGHFYLADCGAPAGGVDGYPPCVTGARALKVFKAPAPAPPAAITLTVNVAAERQPISPYIYGLNFAKESLADELDLPVRRWGGNHTTRYNWQGNWMNHGSDWYFHNNIHYDPYTGATQTADQWVDQNERTGSASLITVPIIGYVAKDGDPDSCGFQVSKYGPQDDVDDESGFPNCGNGMGGGVPIAGNDPLDTSLIVTPSFASGWVNHLAATHGAADAGGVQFYALDNEPELWSETHRDVYPDPQTYDELRDRSYAYGAAIKAADPAAQLFGYAAFGWSGYWYSQYDLVTAAQNGYTYFPDYATHGNQYQVEWYLQQMAQYEQTNGMRLLDYLDLHFYPENGVSLTTAGNADRQALRLRSTRALWDPTYRDESWIGGDDQPADWRYVRLIPRMRDWVDAHYSGTKLAITEYNWGGLEHINGALAQADVLGIFGREGLDLAALWNYPAADLGYDDFETLPGAYAFRMYRNYDGNGGQFGDVSVSAASADESQLAIYAAQHSADSSLTLVIINKTDAALTGALTLSGFSPAASGQVYRYSAANLDAIVRQADQAMSVNGFTASFPASSITLIHVETAPTLPYHVYAPLVSRTGFTRLTGSVE
jgi:sugar lactone lactonase YvrE